MNLSPSRTRDPVLITELAMILAAGCVRLILRRESPCESAETEHSCLHSVDSKRGQETTT